MKKNHPNENTDESKLDHWYGGITPTPAVAMVIAILISIALIITGLAIIFVQFEG